MYRFKARTVRVVDGDTIDFELDLGFHITKRVRIRLRDFDAPELLGDEKEAGLEMKARVEDILTDGIQHGIEVETSKDTSFDRWMGNVYVGSKNLVELLDGN